MEIEQMMDMNIRRSESGNRAQPRRASGPGARPGPKPTVDADSDTYRVVSVRMSDDFSVRLKLAATLAGITQRELIITAVQPEVDRILKEHNLSV